MQGKTQCILELADGYISIIMQGRTQCILELGLWRMGTSPSSCQVSRLSLIELGLGSVLRTSRGGCAILRAALNKLRSLRSRICILGLLLLLLRELCVLLLSVLLSVLLRIASKLLALLSRLTSLLQELSLGERLLILLILQCLGILLRGVSRTTPSASTVWLLLLRRSKSNQKQNPNSSSLLCM